METETSTEAPNNTETAGSFAHPNRTETAKVGTVDDWTVGSMKMRRVGERPVAVVRTESGFHAVDNACPHQGYGLVTGALDGDLITCQWHNWKFDVKTGHCVIGEEDVACHPVHLDDGEVYVSVTSPTADEQRSKLWPSLERGIESHYVGQISRDSVRLLETGVTPAEIMATGARATESRTAYGVGHSLAMAADCLAMAEVRHGTEQALPLVQGLAGLAETTRGRPARPLPEPDPSIDVPAAIEAEDATAAMAGVLGAIRAGVEPATIRRQMIEAASAHHLSYGHGMIYTQKTFEFLDRVGWDNAADVVPHLAASLVWSTREDTLPYMSKAMKRLALVDLRTLAAAPRHEGWDPTELAWQLLNATDAPIDDAVQAVANGAGIEGLLDAVSLGASQRLLRHNLDVELDIDDPFGWLDITHVLTTSQAVRWAWRADPGPDTARAALFAVWLLFDSGRSERKLDAANPSRLADAGRFGSIAEKGGSNDADQAKAGSDLATALTYRNPEQAVALAMTVDRTVVGDALAEASLADRAGSFIVAAHLVKTVEAARREAEIIDSPLPLAAAARFLAAPRLERFVARNVSESIGFVTTGRPPSR